MGEVWGSQFGFLWLTLTLDPHGAAERSLRQHFQALAWSRTAALVEEFSN